MLRGTIIFLFFSYTGLAQTSFNSFYSDNNKITTIISSFSVNDYQYVTWNILQPQIDEQITGLEKSEVVLNIYPNPTQSTITVSDEIFNNYIIYSASGKEVVRSTFNQQIDFSKFLPGTYVLVLQNQKYYSIHKIVKE